MAREKRQGAIEMRYARDGWWLVIVVIIAVSEETRKRNTSVRDKECEKAAQSRFGIGARGKLKKVASWV